MTDEKLIKQISKLDDILQFMEECDKKPGNRFLLGRVCYSSGIGNTSYFDHKEVPIDDNVEKVLIEHYTKKREELRKQL